MNWLLNRLREASTWRGLVWLLTVSGVALRPDQVEAIVLTGMAIAGLLGVFLQDKARDTNERTRKTDIPEIDLVGRSEPEPYTGPAQASPPNTFSVTCSEPPVESLDRMCNARLQTSRNLETLESSVRSDGGG
jgi:hypothetical protein